MSEKDTGWDYFIRQEKEEDYPIIYDLIKTAFETANHVDGDEQDYAVGLRNSNKYIPQLALVAEADEGLIGHIMFTKKQVDMPDGNKYEALLLAPLSVLLQYRDIGVGSELIREGFYLAKAMGYKAVFLAGDPAYYHRFGFKAISNYGIFNTNGFPDENVMVCELVPGALKGITGKIDLL